MVMDSCIHQPFVTVTHVMHAMPERERERARERVAERERESEILFLSISQPEFSAPPWRIS